jgi:hypothetical protein
LYRKPATGAWHAGAPAIVTERYLTGAASRRAKTRKRPGRNTEAQCAAGDSAGGQTGDSGSPEHPLRLALGAGEQAAVQIEYADEDPAIRELYAREAGDQEQ